MKKLTPWLAGIMVLLGIVHTGTTPMWYKSMSLELYWFAGTGLGLIFLGCMNLVFHFSESREKLAVLLVGIPNLIAFIYFIALAVRLKEAQAWIAVAVQIGILNTIFLKEKQVVRQQQHREAKTSKK